MILAVVLSGIIIVGWIILQPFLFPPPPAQQQATSAPAQAPPAAGTQGTTAAPGASTIAAAPALVDRKTALEQSPRIAIDSPRLKGSIALKGGRIDDVVLADYRETTEPNSPSIVLLSPAGASNTYFAEFGWCRPPDCKLTRDLPNKDTIWQPDGQKLTPDRPLTLTWDNGQGLRFAREFSLDANYMFTVTQRVENHGAAPLVLAAYGQIQRLGTPHTGISTILHEGPIGAFGRTADSEKYRLYETKYSKIRDTKIEEHDSVGGWLGITDKYWLVAAVPDPNTPLHATYFWELQNQTDVYQVSYRATEQTIAPGAVGEAKGSLFAGAKEVNLIDRYGEDFDGAPIPLFDRAVDFTGYLGGITYALTFIAKPLFYVLDHIYRVVGNFGVAIMVLTVLVKAVLLPLVNKSYRAMNKMKKLGPQMQELRTRLGDDKVRLNQEMMALYKREKVNPAAGCLPLLVQMPVFLALYQVLYVTIEMRQAPFFGWIRDLSAPDPTSLLNLFDLLPWQVPHGTEGFLNVWGLDAIPVLGHPIAGILSLLSIGVWPLVMGVTMFLQQKMNPPPPDPVQAKIFMFLPIMFTFMLAPFAAGLVIYWAWNNLLSIAQQWLLKRLDARREAQATKRLEHKPEKRT